jgi:hypothetical protein
MVLAALALLSAAAITVFYSNGWLLYYGDAEAHLNIARRMVDSRTPGWATRWVPCGCPCCTGCLSFRAVRTRCG